MVRLLLNVFLEMSCGLVNALNVLGGEVTQSKGLYQEKRKETRLTCPDVVSLKTKVEPHLLDYAKDLSQCATGHKAVLSGMKKPHPSGRQTRLHFKFQERPHILMALPLSVLKKYQ